MTPGISVEGFGEDEPSQQYAKGALRVIGVDSGFDNDMKNYMITNWGYEMGMHHFRSSSVKYLFDYPPDLAEDGKGIAVIMLMARDADVLGEDITQLLLDLESNGLSGFEKCPYHPNPITAYVLGGMKNA